LNIKEVANKVGVSITTVSRVLNSPEKVNEETKKKVLDTMEELNYTPNWFARNIQNKRTNIIGIIVPDTL
jgi:DNA-binding LacI/PurR family transcriptional regulator